MDQWCMQFQGWNVLERWVIGLEVGGCASRQRADRLMHFFFVSSWPGEEDHCVISIKPIGAAHEFINIFIYLLHWCRNVAPTWWNLSVLTRKSALSWKWSITSESPLECGRAINCGASLSLCPSSQRRPASHPGLGCIYWSLLFLFLFFFPFC